VAWPLDRFRHIDTATKPPTSRTRGEIHEAAALLRVHARAPAGDVHSAFAQSAPDAIALDEVVVTAQKRAENVQNVPLAVSVVTARQLESAGVKEFTDVSRVAPSLTIRQADQPINASVALRGIGTFAYGIGVEPSVAVQLDDVPVSFQARAFSDLTDVERIEVLRGPQSTLYGKSASAGLINITTRDPSAKFSVLANVLATDDHEYRGAVSLSGPIGETLGYRLSASRSEYDGNVKNLYDGKKINGRDETSIRGKLLWRPIDDLKVTLGASYIDGVATSNATMRVYTPGATLRGTPGLTSNVTMPGVVAGEENLTVSNDTPPYAKSEGFGQSLKVEYELPKDFTLVSITSHDQFRLDDQLDSDRTSYAASRTPRAATSRPRPTPRKCACCRRATGTFRYTLGLFYGDNDLRRSFKRGPVFSLAQWYARPRRRTRRRSARLNGPSCPRPRRSSACATRRKTSASISTTSRTATPSSRAATATSPRPIAWACATR
jgi:iron complex outermembrane receptor protein